MTDLNGPNFSIGLNKGVNSVNFNGSQKPQGEESLEADENPKLNDFSDPKAEALGRSMLFKGADDVNHDLKALLDNPQIAENSDKMFDVAYAAAQDAEAENPYEEAASFATGNMQ